jgi:uncharacterized protein YkwD
MNGFISFDHVARAVLALAALAAVVLLAGPAASAEARGSCGKTGVASKRSDRIKISNARYAVKCLINDERSASNLKLRRSLSKAAQRHSRKMYKKGCFSHHCPGEPALDGRIRRTGYLNGASSYRFGEVIALNTDKASPREVVRQWKKSAGHRVQILSSAYEHMGVGVVADNGKAFYTVTLGARSG